MRAAVAVWAVAFVVVTGLYILGPVFYFNRAEPAILGMPPLYFWFILLPLITPAILGTAYLLDRHFGGIGNHVNERR